MRTYTLSLLAAAAAALVTAAVTPAIAWDVPAMNAQIDATNFLMDADCSGTLVDAAHGIILTANHCVANQFEVVTRQVVDKDGKVTEVKVKVAKPGSVSQIDFINASETRRVTYTYKIKAIDEAHDLALVQVVAVAPGNSPFTRAAPLACEAPVRGDTVYAVGNPFVVLYATVTKGIVASVNRTYRQLGIIDDVTAFGDNPLMQITAPIEGGNSGGAAYNDRGELIGVLVRASQVNETVVFAVPLEDIRSFLTENGVTLPKCP